MRRDALSAFFAVLFLSIFVGPAFGPAFADKRVALVIGNGAYARAPHLPNPSHDAEDVAAALKRTGFDTILGIDLDQAGMQDAAIRFARAARTADVAVFYYSGHAMQYAGVNYLVPIDAQLHDEADLRRMARVDEILSDLQQAKNLRILVLDSCRDNPLADELKRSIGLTRSASIGRGLAKMESPDGTIVSYSTQAGRTAVDGTGRNSPYTSAFLRHIEDKDDIATVFHHISANVYETTRGTQVPELSLSFFGEFYLNGPLQINVGPTTPTAPAAPCAAAETHWKSTEAIGSVAAFEDHLAQFPSCAFAGLAKARIESLKNQVAVVAPPVPPATTAPAVATNLTGRWSANDGGTYMIRQSGTRVSWEGVSADYGRTWTHTFNGVIRDNVIVGSFFDHPPGKVRNSGDLKIRIVDANRLEMVVRSGPFRGSVWIRTVPIQPRTFTTLPQA
jgi:Caspase domain